MFPSGWSVTVKKTPTELVPVNWKTRPICGFSPQRLCTLARRLVRTAD
jgi:hypothetical protein